MASFGRERRPTADTLKPPHARRTNVTLTTDQEKRLQHLRKVIDRADNLYYNTGNPIT